MKINEFFSAHNVYYRNLHQAKSHFFLLIGFFWKLSSLKFFPESPAKICDAHYLLQLSQENKTHPPPAGGASAAAKPKSEVLTFKKKKIEKVLSVLSMDVDSVSKSDLERVEKKTEKLGEKQGKKARFAESVVTHEYVETESDVKAKTKTVSRAANAQEEVEKVENECKQSWFAT